MDDTRLNVRLVTFTRGDPGCDLSGAGEGISASVIQAAKLVRAPCRLPHHSCSLTGLISELALSMGGILFFEQIEEFNFGNVAQVLGIVRMADPRFQPRIFMRFFDPMTTDRRGEFARAVGQHFDSATRAEFAEAFPVA